MRRLSGKQVPSNRQNLLPRFCTNFMPVINGTTRGPFSINHVYYERNDKNGIIRRVKFASGAFALHHYHKSGSRVFRTMKKLRPPRRNVANRARCHDGASTRTMGNTAFLFSKPPTETRIAGAEVVHNGGNGSFALEGAFATHVQSNSLNGMLHP